MTNFLIKNLFINHHTYQILKIIIVFNILSLGCYKNHQYICSCLNILLSPNLVEYFEFDLYNF